MHSNTITYLPLSTTTTDLLTNTALAYNCLLTLSSCWAPS